MMTKLSTLKVTCAAAVAICGAMPALSQSLPNLGQSDTGWRHGIAVYSFAPVSTTGTSTIADVSTDVEWDLQDILDLLEFALAGRYEAWNGDWGVIVDANYAAIGTNGTLSGPLKSDVEIDVRQEWIGLLGAYRVSTGTYGANNQAYAFDIQGGVRYNSIKQTIDIDSDGVTPATDAAAAGGGGSRSFGDDKSWFEPVIGARGMWRLNDRWTTIAAADFGGFGAGGNDLQVSANIGFDYQPWENTAITFGYRYLSVDYSDTLSDGEFAYDVVQHGPYIGLKYFFK